MLIHQLPVEMVQKPKAWSYAPVSMGNSHNLVNQAFPFVSTAIHSLEASAGENGLVRVPVAMVTIGKPGDFPSYGWDCDYGQREVK